MSGTSSSPIHRWPGSIVTSSLTGANVSRPVTAGWRTGRLESLYPKGIQIGRVTSVGQADTDLYKQVQVEPFADVGSLDAVIVLVPKDRIR